MGIWLRNTGSLLPTFRVNDMEGGAKYPLLAVFLLAMLANCVECIGTHRLCGTDLADVLALVCKETGYNYAIKPQGDRRGRRNKRGIVDECCRRGCTLKTLQSYCSNALPTKKDSVQISKRSRLTSSEARAKLPLGRGTDERRLSDNTIGTDRKLRPLVVYYSDGFRTESPSYKPANLDINSLKKHDNVPSNSMLEKQEFDRIPLDDFNSQNIPLDTSEIMAEVVETPDPSIRKKRFAFRRNTQHD